MPDLTSTRDTTPRFSPKFALKLRTLRMRAKVKKFQVSCSVRLLNGERKSFEIYAFCIVLHAQVVVTLIVHHVSINF